MDICWLANMLRDELDGGWLQVCKVRTPTGWIRVPVSVNAEWYQVFCSRYEWRRSRKYPKPRTIIKRRDTLAALRRIADGNRSGVYAERIIEFMLDWCDHYRRPRKCATYSSSSRRPASQSRSADSRAF